MTEPEATPAPTCDHAGCLQHHHYTGNSLCIGNRGFWIEELPNGFVNIHYTCIGPVPHHWK